MNHGNPQASISPIQAALASFIVDTRFEDLPPDLVTRMKWSLLDSLGCGLHGSQTEWGRIIAGHATAQGTGRARLWASSGDRRVPPAAAALANGTMIQSFELDDVHFGSRSHPGSVTVPVAMAMVDDGVAVSGRQLIEAMAVGYELLVRVGGCQGVSSFNRGWHPTGTAGVFAAAATASRLLGLDASQTTHALGIAGTMPAGIMAAQFGAMVKRLFSGHAAWAGLSATMLARSGFTGITDIFDVDFGGYPKAVSDEISLDALTEGLGTRYEAGSIGYKLYACVGTNHTMLAALEDIVAREKPSWHDIDEIRIRTSEYQVLHSGWPYEPSTVMAAQMNMQYCAAALLIHGAVFVEQFEPQLLADPDILALAGRVKVITNTAQAHKDRTAEVEVALQDGRVLRAACSAARGHPANPPDSGDIERKFSRLAQGVLPLDNIQRVIDIVASLETQNELTTLSALLSPTIATRGNER
ncbi:MAG: MmgE/PrpD family protein [Burkholderiales bacterium]|nr:MmgE/PrpD family protein [Burkholderiales bacterium]ODU77327.1 MAG: hypothetical protein ABT00_14260 [Bordetella sp. SCN 68-11]